MHIQRGSVAVFEMFMNFKHVFSFALIEFYHHESHGVRDLIIKRTKMANFLFGNF